MLRLPKANPKPRMRISTPVLPNGLVGTTFNADLMLSDCDLESANELKGKSNDPTLAELAAFKNFLRDIDPFFSNMITPCLEVIKQRKVRESQWRNRIRF